MNLSDLRARWTIANEQVQGLGKTIDNCIADAAKFRAGYLAGEQQATDDLMAINTRYDRIKPRYGEAMDDRQAIVQMIRHCYAEAERLGDRIDWLQGVLIVGGTTRSSWDRVARSIDRLFTSVELIEPELVVLTELFQRSVRSPLIKIQSTNSGYLLQVERPTYRDTCYDELGAEAVINCLEPIVSNRRQRQISGQLPVLNIGPNWRTLAAG
jgi:hypothetical protein